MTLGARWAWARLIENPSYVSDDHVRIVYRLNKPSCKLWDCQSTCKSVPFCLNGLSSLSVAELRDPNLEEGNNGATQTGAHSQPIVTPNGLKNYGSTCYLNAFLQLYFRFDELRQAIFSLPVESDETGVIYQLQLIFSQLEFNKSGVVDPGGLIECLRLCQEEQQDAPEFHSLFMHLLESRFRESGLSIVDELLRGEYVYETRCLNCGFTSRQPSNFLELPLKVSSNSLPGCLADYMKEESLTGENQYACPVCQTKHDGVRRVFITRAPRLLCLQLLRFTYDPRTGQRKKQKATVRIPDALRLVGLPAASEMTGATIACSTTAGSNSEGRVACLSDSENSRLYRLCGVLLHIGAQPTSGHYVAVVREPPTNPNSADASPQGLTDHWTVCNDTEVYTIPASQFCLAKVTGSSKGWQTSLNGGEQLEHGPARGSRTKRPCNHQSRSSKKPRQTTNDGPLASSTTETGCAEEAVPSQPDEDFESSAPDSASDCLSRWHSSPSAYMLFYQLVDPDRPKLDMRIPSDWRCLVEELNFAQDEQARDLQLQKENKLACLRNLVTNLRVSTPDPNDSGPPLDALSLVPTHWIRKWLDEPDRSPPDPLSNPEGLPVNGAAMASESVNGKPVDRSSFKQCPHGRVPIDLDAFDYRAVSTEGLAKLLNAQQPPVSANNGSKPHDADVFRRFQPCRDCICLKVALIQLEQRIRALAKEMDGFIHSKDDASLSTGCSDLPGNETSPSSDHPTNRPEYFWVGRRSLRQWRNLCRTYVSRFYADSNVDARPSPPTTFNADALCPHGHLRLNSKRVRRMPAPLWSKLIALLPGANIPTFPAPMGTAVSSHRCTQCEAFEQSLSQRAASERDAIPRLLLHTFHQLPGFRLEVTKQMELEQDVGSNTPKCSTPMKRQPESKACVIKSEPDRSDSMTEQSPTVHPDAVYLIPFDFVQRWRRFVRNPCPESLPGKLESGLSVHGVVCEHGHLSMPWENLLSEYFLCPVSATEYRILTDIYSSHADSERDATLVDEPDNDSSDGETVIAELTSAPPMYLLPSTDDATQRWRLCADEFPIIVCAACHARLLAERSQFKDARLRVRLVKELEEALIASAADPASFEPTGDLLNGSAAEDLPNQSVQQRPQEMGESVLSETADVSTESSTSSFEPDSIPTNAPIISSTKTSRGRPKPPLSNGIVRRSNRHRLCSNDLVVRGSSDQLLQEFKVQLMNLLGVTPVDQHLILNGVELGDPQKTLGELGICVDSLLYLWTEVQPWDSDEAITEKALLNQKRSEKDPSKMSYATRPWPSAAVKEPVELGFKGTRLLNN